jgi:hypothetical protein
VEIFSHSCSGIGLGIFNIFEISFVDGSLGIIRKLFNWLGTVLRTWELFGSFNIKKMGGWEPVS